MLKRVFDITASLLGLLACSPLLLVIAVWIKLDSSGPVFYRGERAGRNGKSFRIFKFRSMVMNADKLGGPSTSDDDSRVTNSGRFIRKFKLDELSQLINVLLGEMSLVGPRPEIIDKVAKYTEEERRVLTLRPGITDWASIWNSDEGGVLLGVSDPDAIYEQVLRPTKLRLQLHYCQQRTLLGDVKIIVYTLLKVFHKKWVPKELQGYPTFDELRATVQEISATDGKLERLARAA